MVLMIRSACGRTRSIDNNPFFKSAPSTSMPSASTKVRCNAAVEVLAAFVVLLASADHQLTFLDADVELVAGESGNRKRDAQPFGVLPVMRQPFDVVRRIAVGALGNAVEHALDLIEAQQKRTG
jgi:hypothetical protein